jgi:hypothetical protein
MQYPACLSFVKCQSFHHYLLCEELAKGIEYHNINREEVA